MLYLASGCNILTMINSEQAEAICVNTVAHLPPRHLWQWWGVNKNGCVNAVNREERGRGTASPGGGIMLLQISPLFSSPPVLLLQYKLSGTMLHVLLTICFTLRWCSTAVRLHVYLNFVFNQLNRSSNYISEYHTSSVPAIALLCWMVNLHCSHLMTSQVAIADCRHRLLGNCATSLGDLLKISPTAASSQCWSSTTVTQAPGSGRHNLIQVLSNVLAPIFYLFSDLWPACENVQGLLVSDLCGLDPHPVVGQPSVNLHQEWIGGASVRLVMMIKMAIAHEHR